MPKTFAYVPDPEDYHRKHRRPAYLENASDVIREILNTHGHHHRTARIDPKPRFTKTEKAICCAFAVVVMGITLFGCYQLITAFVDSPIVVSVEHVDNGLVGDDFPAVTICNIRKWLAKGTQQSNFVDRLAHIKRRRNRAMPHCAWTNKAKPCDQLFDMTLTDWETYCYSFNYGYPEKFTASELFLRGERDTEERGNLSAETDHQLRGKPSPLRRVGGLGLRNGLSVMFDILRQENGGNEPVGLVTVKRESLGLMILVHHPEEFPLMSFKSVHIAPGLENNVLIHVNKIVTSDSVYTHPAAKKKRNCYKDDERRLRFFKTYSDSACRLECILNRTLNECGCRHWTTPGFPRDKVCYTDDEVKCYNSIADNSYSQEDPSQSSEYWTSCRCLPLCDYTNYDFAVNHALLDAVSVAERFNKTVEYARYNMAIANVYFGDSKIVVYRREALTTIAKLCSNIGGIIGSVVGWSLLSAGKTVFEAIRRFSRRPTSRQNRTCPLPSSTSLRRPQLSPTKAWIAN